ncbi:MAG: hypothetical protein OFPII_14880 [Osedax symbiont Rs1]|nr:MAG: hypothetical protein OFPII_14880 [Osedax symbiont Rs1]
MDKVLQSRAEQSLASYLTALEGLNLTKKVNRVAEFAAKKATWRA